MNAADRRRLTPPLVVLAVLLALLLIALWAGFGRGVHWQAAGAAPRLPAPGAASAAPAVPPFDHFAAVWQHPLFSPDRTPVAPSDGGAGSSGDLELTGVIMLPGLNLAIVHDKSTGKDYRVREGASVRGGPRLVSLAPRSAVLESAGSRVQLTLIPGPADAASPAAGAAPADGAQPLRRGSAANSSAARVQALRRQIEARRRRSSQNGGR